MAGDELDDDKQADLNFDKGFQDETPPAPPAAKTEPEPAKVETKPETKAKTKPKDGAKAEPEGKDKAEVIPPEYVQITKEQLENLQGAAGKMATFEARLEKAFGQMGGIQRIVKELQDVTPSGKAVELPEDVVSELQEEYPELAGLIRKTLEKALKGQRGTATEEKDAKPDPNAVVEKLVNETLRKRELEALEDSHPEWREIVGAVSDGKFDPEHPFRKWLATKDTAYQHKINSTESSAVLKAAIDLFKQDTKPKPAEKQALKPNHRAERIEGAVQPKGDGGHPASSTPAVDPFDAGFASG